MDLNQGFHAFITSKQLLKPTDRVLVAVSGGIDSVVLAQLFRTSKLKFGIAHCNFKLRAKESDLDAESVRKIGAEWNAPVYVQDFDTQKYAAENGVSVQMAARELRYAWFEEIRKSENFDLIATGHNLNDSVETMLLNLIRGTGLTGLGGIPVQNGEVIRPLLFASREDISTYANQQNISWREDSSNFKDDYTRNAIRQHILPKMVAINPSFLQSVSKSMEQWRAADGNLQYLLEQFIGNADANGVHRIAKNTLSGLPFLQDALFDLLQPFGFTGDQTKQIVQSWDQSGAEWQSSSGYRLLIDREVLLLTKQEKSGQTILIAEDDLMVRIPENGQLFFTSELPDAEFPDGRVAILVDKEKIRFPLRLRHWQNGDAFQPFGMAGKHQKLQDFFTNQKLSVLDKEHVWVLEDKEARIVWVLGMRMDERFKIDESSSKCLKITWINPSNPK